MRIKEIVLDGFKSYSQRTLINGFDENFNAITGLNGSGKSNILDAICFVLGISTLATVRANHIQELIYKNGQAGVTKANVTILFDNTDKSRSHEAYKKFDEISVRREVALGGTSKYTINGTKVTGEKVRQLFSMSGLNVNNANFLVMQGRITQVINMRPNEILSLVEETAGTNVYEEHRRKALGLMEKKERKLEEIDNILNTDVLPKLDVLKKEKEEYLIWSQKVEELEASERKIIYAKYIEAQNMSSNSEEILKNLVNNIDKYKSKLLILQQKIDKLTAEIDELVKMQSNDDMEIERNNLEELQRDLAKQEGELKNKVKELEAVIISIKSHKHQLQELKNTDRKLEMEIKEIIESSKAAQFAVEGKRTELESLKNKFQAIQQGLDIGTDLTSDRISEKEAAFARLEGEAKSNALRIEEEEQKHNYILNQLQQYQGQQSEDVEKISVLKREIEEMSRQVENPALERRLGDLQTKKRRLEDEAANLDRQIESMDVGRFNVRYPDPEPNFDRSKVKGRVIRLIEIPNRRFARAIEAGAAGRLYAVVVDSDKTATLLLNRKSLGNVLLLPENKMRPTALNPQTKKTIAERFGDRAHLALDLIKYDKDVANSIQYVFGSFYVCENREIAQGIAYDPHIRQLAVTLEGDIYDPNGVISGGEATTGESKIIKIQEVRKIEQQREEYRREIYGLQNEISHVQEEQNALNNIKHQIERKKNELRHKERLAEESSYNSLMASKQETQGLIEILNKKQQEFFKKIKAVEKELKEMQAKSRKGGDLKASLSEEIKRLEKELKRAEKERKDLMKSSSELEEEKHSNLQEIQETAEKVDKDETLLKEVELDVDSFRAKTEEQKAYFESRQQEFDKLNEEIIKNNQLTKDLTMQREKHEKEYKGIELALINTENDRKTILQKMQSGKNIVTQYDEKYPWLSEIEFDLSHFDLQLEEAKHAEEARALEREGKKINRSVSATLDDQIKSLTELEEKRKVVITDKSEIQNLIDHLDREKESCIEKTWTQVDLNLSEIFSTLLPGADARLIQSEGKISGLELAVAFNGVRKGNLSELSGGQKSLLALSFILALLKYNPAPIYILDEIDAALDLSHTQNIGDTVRKYFGSSQFIVVSLKDGMFNNANVLYKTSFHDGRSFVERVPLRSEETNNRLRYR